MNGMYSGVRYGTPACIFFLLSRGTYSYSYKSIGAGTACIPYYSVLTLYLQSSFSISVRICHSAWMITVRIGFQVLLYILLVVALEIYPVGMIPHNNQSLQSSQLQLRYTSYPSHNKKRLACPLQPFFPSSFYSAFYISLRVMDFLPHTVRVRTIHFTPE